MSQQDSGTADVTGRRKIACGVLKASFSTQKKRRLSLWQTAAVVEAKNWPVVVGQGSACTPLLSAAEMHLHAALRNAQAGGEMTGFLRLGEQDIFSPITVEHGRALLTGQPGLGIEVDREKLARAAAG